MAAGSLSSDYPSKTLSRFVPCGSFNHSTVLPPKAGIKVSFVNRGHTHHLSPHYTLNTPKKNCSKYNPVQRHAAEPVRASQGKRKGRDRGSRFRLFSFLLLSFSNNPRKDKRNGLSFSTISPRRDITSFTRKRNTLTVVNL